MRSEFKLGEDNSKVESELYGVLYIRIYPSFDVDYILDLNYVRYRLASITLYLKTLYLRLYILNSIS